MNASRILKATLLISMVLPVGIATAEDDPGTAAAALDRIKALEGTWLGRASGGGEAEVVVNHTFRVSAGGTVVMETMGSGDPDQEMINMYHLDGDDLVLTHYCSGGNQPTMKLAQPLSTPTDLRFDFTGGTNFDPQKDEHVHATRLVIVDDGHIESSWTGYQDGKDAGTRTFTLKRSR